MTGGGLRIAQITTEPGEVTEIHYVAVDNSPWRASLQAVGHGLFPGSVNDPEFIHYRGASGVANHRNAWIKYKAHDGSFWSAQCRSRADHAGVVITFAFEHWPGGRENDRPHHVSNELAFLGWDGRPWLAEIAPLPSPGVPKFSLQRAT